MSFLFKQECFDIIGACMELHRELGKGYSEAVSDLLPEHRAQLINYLKITGKKVGLLVNFAKPSLQFERLVYEEEKANA